MTAPKYKTLQECFDANVLKGEGCWICIQIHSNGYGRFPFKGVRLYAHRVAWELYRGAIPKGILVLHSCDNTLCCNPEHLFLGTQQDNVADMFNKGRGFIPRIFKVTPLVRERILDLSSKGLLQKRIATECGISIRTVNRIISENRNGYGS